MHVSEKVCCAAELDVLVPAVGIMRAKYEKRICVRNSIVADECGSKYLLVAYISGEVTHRQDVCCAKNRALSLVEFTYFSAVYLCQWG